MPGKSDVHPLWAEFNTYYLNINVVTNTEVKQYNSTNGKLSKIHSSMADTAKQAEIV